MSESLVTQAPAAARGFWPAPPLRLYGLLDAAQDERIFAALRVFAATEDIVPLYEGAAMQELAAVGPYLLSLDPEGAAADWLLENWHRGWAVCLASDAPIAELRSHLRRLTRARTEDGRAFLFRFYDAAILPVFLPTCDAGQLAQIFGPIDHMHAVAGHGTVAFSCNGGALEVQAVALPGG